MANSFISISNEIGEHFHDDQTFSEFCNHLSLDDPNTNLCHGRVYDKLSGEAQVLILLWIPRQYHHFWKIVDKYWPHVQLRNKFYTLV